MIGERDAAKTARSVVESVSDMAVGSWRNIEVSDDEVPLQTEQPQGELPQEPGAQAVGEELVANEGRPDQHAQEGHGGVAGNRGDGRGVGLRDFEAPPDAFQPKQL